MDQQNREYDTSERGEINNGFYERQKELNEKEDDKKKYEFYPGKPVKLSLSATRGHDIRNWTTEETKVMEPGETLVFDCGEREFRLKLLGTEQYFSKEEHRPDGLQPRVSVDRFEEDTDEWVEYIEQGGPEGCSVIMDLSFSISVEQADTH